jgi:hypothetical protein
MNKRPASLVVIVFTFLTVSLIGAEKTSSPTFSKDVAPILYKNCASCHRPGDIAPMPLLTYEQVRPWAKSIREKVSLGQMPPWHATQPRGTFLNDRRLTDLDKETLSRWVKDGSPQGDAKDLPPVPTFTEGWEIGTPDTILSMAKSYDVPPSGTINYQYFTVPTNFTEDKWVQAIEVRPGTRSVVHHVLVFCREPGAPGRQNAFVQVTPPIKADALRAHDPNDTQTGARPNSLTLVATTAPGTNAMTFQPGTAIRLKAGAVLVFQIHYTANGKASSDTTRVGMVFAKEPPRQEIRNSAFVNPSFILPAGDPNKEVDSAIQFTEDSHIWALFPHTHLRGKSWEYRLVYPDGRTETVLGVPKYDFNWQTYYLFATPLAVPKGARLEATAHYDNSAGNAWNPDPKVDVKWGEQTWQEMQYTGITYTVDDAHSPEQK